MLDGVLCCICVGMEGGGSQPPSEGRARHDASPRLACCCAVVDVVGVLLYKTADATTLGAVQF